MDSPGAHGYRAFISYRHVEPDRRWAKRIHAALETRSLPPLGGVRLEGLEQRRVFRDEDELAASADLSLEIQRALENAQWLIVICSEQTPASRWVDAEVTRFLALRGPERVIPVLVQGTPETSFPAALSSGPETLERVLVDARRIASQRQGQTDERVESALLAQVFDVEAGDLAYWRGRERVRRRVLGSVSLAAAILIAGATAVVSFQQMSRADRQRERAQKNTGVAVA